MKRAVCMVLAAIAILTGCGREEGAKAPAPVRSVQTLQFEVNTNLDKEFLEQAELFAADVEKISGGRMVIRVVRRQSEAPPEAEYDFAYLRNSQMAAIEPSLATLSLPFLYSSSDHLSLALNSPEMMKILSSRLKGLTVPLTALSSGSTLLVTTVSGTQKEVDISTYFQNLLLALHEDSGAAIFALRALGAQVVPFPKGTSLMPLLANYHVDEMTVNAVEATREEVLAMIGDPSGIFAVETMHDISPVWLTVKPDTWATLSDWERAVIREATAGLISGYEENRRRYRAAWEKEVGKKGIVLLQLEQQVLSATIYNAGSGSTDFQIPSYFDKKLFDLVQSY